MKKLFITEISENDFKKLNLKVIKTEGPGKYVECSLNDILDKQIQMTIDAGYESDYVDLHTPVTIAIHKECEGSYLSQCYLDKFMNQFTGAQSFQIGWGIKHLYSTRDYYECHEDYWRVKKNETEVIYRVHLNERPFILKHKTEVTQLSENISIHSNYDYDLINGEWVLRNKTKVTKNGQSTSYEPYDI